MGTKKAQLTEEQRKKPPGGKLLTISLGATSLGFTLAEKFAVFAH